MPDYYYQIKGRRQKNNNDIEDEDYFSGGVWGSNWSFPPLHSGMVTAEDKKQAKLIIEQDFGRPFPLRVLNKDLETQEYLLVIEEMKGSRYALFEERNCKYCDTMYRIIDQYNDMNSTWSSYEYCCNLCREEDHKLKVATGYDGYKNPIIYKITNKITNKSYIGKTTQAFTLRWYQHFFQPSTNKFHTEIRNSKVTDWIFEVLEEVLEYPEDIRYDLKLKEQYVLDRERFHIEQYNSINEGYNSI